MRIPPLLAALATIGAAAVAPAAHAQNAPVPPDLIKAGQLIATKGAGEAVPACESCHTGVGQFPLLAGDASYYIVKQLADFRTAKRVDPIMAPIAKALKDNQIEAVAAYFQSLPRKKAPAPAGDAAAIERGRLLSIEGDSNRDIFACDTCHGPGGKGGDFVALNGQNPAYMLKQIQDFRAGKRSNDELGIMQAIAKKLTDDDVRAAAAFYNQADLSPRPAPPPKNPRK